MHMGSLALIGSRKPKNFFHIMFNNSAHESVGGLPTVMSDMNITDLVKSCGYKNVFTASNSDELIRAFQFFDRSKTGRIPFDTAVQIIQSQGMLLSILVSKPSQFHFRHSSP